MRIEGLQQRPPFSGRPRPGAATYLLSFEALDELDSEALDDFGSEALDWLAVGWLPDWLSPVLFSPEDFSSCSWALLERAPPEEER